MFELRVDAVRNRLYIRLEGQLSDREALDAAASVLDAATRLRPGYGLVNDVSSLQGLSAFGWEEMVRVVRAFRDGGCARVVRVVGRSARATLFLERIARRMGYSANLAFSREEADALLDRLENHAVAREAAGEGTSPER